MFAAGSMRPEWCFVAQEEGEDHPLGRVVFWTLPGMGEPFEVALEVGDGNIHGLVEDDGEGFDPEVVEATPSWGVGLGSMRERLEMLGGSLRVDSEPGAGTRAEMRVPLDGRRP